MSLTKKSCYIQGSALGSQFHEIPVSRKFLVLGLGSIFQNIGIGIDYTTFWDWGWDYEFRTKSQEIPKVIIEI